MFPVTKDRRRKTVSSGCEDHGQQSRLFSRRSIPAAVPLLPPTNSLTDVPSILVFRSGGVKNRGFWIPLARSKALKGLL